MPLQITRRDFLARAMLAGVAVAGGIETLFLEPGNFQARSVTVRLERLPEAFDGFRIAQISDIHFGPYMTQHGVERALQIAQSFRPDLLALTGDFVSHPWTHANGKIGARFVEPCADALAHWREVRQIAILGNHDHWNDPETVEAGLKERGITVLRNAAVPIERASSRIWVAGTDDAWVRKANLSLALKNIPPDEATILLAHEPDFADHAARFPVDLQLSGHSHGGQVRLPGVGALILPGMGRKYPMGLNRVGNLQVYTNIGLGVVNPPVRFLCPPEVTLMTLAKDRV
jgi:predicted MPP superfamily phosphohydrolase